MAGAPHPEKGEIVVAFVVANPGAPITPEELRRHCRRLAASYKTPDLVELCSELPATPTGKLMRRELKQLAAALVSCGSKER